MQPGHDLDQGGLAGAVVTQHASDLTGIDPQRHPLQRSDRPVVLADSLHLDQRRGRAYVVTHRRHLFAARRRTYMFINVASSSIAPRNVQYQSGFHPAKTMPCFAMPKMNAPSPAPTAEP